MLCTSPYLGNTVDQITGLIKGMDGKRLHHAVLMAEPRLAGGRRVPASRFWPPQNLNVEPLCYGVLIQALFVTKAVVYEMVKYSGNDARELIIRAHKMIDRLNMELGALDHLYFAFPRVLISDFRPYEDPSSIVMAALAAAHNPLPSAVKKIIGAEHPLPSTYIKLNSVLDVEIAVPRKNAKTLLTNKHCLVVEKWSGEFVCRVLQEIRTGIGCGTIAVIGIPPDGSYWNLEVVKKLRDTARAMST